VITPKKNEAAEEFAKAVGIEYRILEDPRLEVAKRFRATQRSASGPTVLPISVLVDPRGVIRCRADLYDTQFCLSDEHLDEVLDRYRPCSKALALQT